MKLFFASFLTLLFISGPASAKVKWETLNTSKDESVPTGVEIDDQGEIFVSGRAEHWWTTQKYADNRWVKSDDWNVNYDFMSDSQGITRDSTGRITVWGMTWTRENPGTRKYVLRTWDKNKNSWDMLTGDLPSALSQFYSFAMDQAKFYAMDPVGAIVYQGSLDHKEWKKIDDMFDPSAELNDQRAFGLFVAADGSVYCLGNLWRKDSNETASWIVQKIRGGKGEVKDKITTEKHVSAATAMTQDRSGNIFAGGYIGKNWIIRKSTDNGESFKTFAEIPVTPEEKNASAGKIKKMITDDVGNLYFISNPKAEWLVVKVEPTGKWEILDEYSFKGTAVPVDLKIQKDGSLLVVGWGLAYKDTSSGVHWIIRRTVN